MHPLIFLLPTWIISVSIPYASNVLATSSSAVYVHPFALGLPLIKITFTK